MHALQQWIMLGRHGTDKEIWIPALLVPSLPPIHDKQARVDILAAMHSDLGISEDSRKWRVQNHQAVILYPRWLRGWQSVLGGATTPVEWTRSAASAGLNQVMHAFNQVMPSDD